MFGRVRVVAGRRIYHVERQSKGLINHLRDNPLEQWTGQFEARIGVDLNQPRRESAVDHEIEPKDFKIMLEPFRREFHEGAANCIQTNRSHFWQDHLLEVIILFLVGGVKVFLEIVVGEFIGRFELAV